MQREAAGPTRRPGESENVKGDPKRDQQRSIIASGGDPWTGLEIIFRGRFLSISNFSKPHALKVMVRENC